MAASRDEVIRFIYEVTGNKDLADTAATMLKVGTAGGEASAEVEAFAAKLSEAAAQSKLLGQALNQKAALGDLNTQYAQAVEGLTQLNAQFDRSDTSSRKVTAAFAAAEAKVGALATQLNLQQVALVKTEGALEKAGIDTTNLAGANAKLRTEANAAAVGLGKIGTSATSAGTGAGALSGILTRIGASLQTTRVNIDGFVSGLLRITGIAGGVGAALGALNLGRFFGGAVTSAKDFESELSQVKAVSGATADELKLMRQAAEDASKTTKFSAAEAAGALGELARASGDASAAIAELPATLNLAQAAGLGAADAATILTTAITQFGLSAADATRVSDLFAREANATNDTVEGLGNSLSYVAPLAKQLGLSIEQTTATLGALAEQGFRGERAGTALRNVFSQLLDPTSNFRNALNGLGIEGNDFSSIIVKLGAAGDKGKQALLSLDSEARPAISALVSTGGAGIRRLTEDFKNAAGEAQRTATVMGENFSGASSRLANAFDTLRRALVDPILDPLAKQFDNAAAKVRAFAETSDFDRIKNAVKDFALGATDAIVGFVSSINFTTVSKSLEDFATNAKTFFASVKESGQSTFSALGTAANSISLVFNGIKTAVLLAGAGLTQGLILLQKGLLQTAEGIAFLRGQGDLLKPKFDEIRAEIAGLTAVQDEFNRRAASGADATGKAWDGLTDSVKTSKPALDAAAATQKTIADQLHLTTEQAVRLAQGYLDLPPALQKIAEPGLRAAGVFAKLAEATPKAAAGAASAADALKKAQAAAAGAYNDVSRFAGAGDSTSAAYLKAKAALDQANAAVAALTGTSQQATAASTALAAAQARLGQTHEQLGATAKTAAGDLDVIYQSFLAGTSSIEDVRSAFERYAADLRASVANSDAWQQQVVEDALAVKQSILGLTGTKPQDIQLPTGNFQGFRQEIDAGSQANEKYTQSTEQRSAAIEASSAATEGARGAMASFSYELKGVGEAGVKAFTDIQNAALKFLIEDTGGAGLQLYIEAINSGTEKLNAAIAQQQEAAAALIAQASNTTDEQLAAMAATAGGAEALAAQLRGVNNQFSLIDGQTLSAVQSATSSLASRLDALKQKTEDALQSFLEYSSSVQDELDRQNGNLKSVEQRRFEEDLARLKAQAVASGTLNSQAYNEAVAAANKLHQLKLKQIEEEASAKKKSDDEASARAAESAAKQKADDEESARRLAAAPPSATPPPAPVAVPTGPTTSQHEISIKLGGIEVGSLKGLSSSQLEEFSRQLLPVIIQQIKTAARATGAFGR